MRDGHAVSYDPEGSVASGEWRVLSVRGVAKNYGDVHALAGVDLEIAAGEIVCLVGPNGAGKTTLVSIVAGLLRPDAGWVHVDDVDVVRDPGTARTRIGLAPQNIGVYPTLTVRRNLEVFGGLAGLRGRALVARVDELLQAFGLSELSTRTARFLSGGEQRRLHTSIAFLHRPRLLLLDEPTVGADLLAREAMLEIVRRSAGDGAAVLYSTHYLAEVEVLGAQIAVIGSGRILACGPVARLVAEHGRCVVEARFRGDAPSSMRRYHEAMVNGCFRIPTDDPAALMTDIIRGLQGAAAGDVEALSVRRPTLESMVTELTGLRAPAEDDA